MKIEVYSDADAVAEEAAAFARITPWYWRIEPQPDN
jgi:hypothetical protein